MLQAGGFTHIILWRGLMIDIADKNQLESYLLAKKLIDPADGYSITYCSGGVSGRVGFVMAGASPLII